MNRHPASSELEAFVVGDSAHRVQIEAHLADCSQCRAVIEALERDRVAFLAAEPAAAFLRRPKVQAALTERLVADAEFLPPSAWVKPSWRGRLWASGGPVLALAAGLAAVVAFGLPTRPSERRSGAETVGADEQTVVDTIRNKGLGPRVPWVLRVNRKRGDRVTQHHGQLSIRPGDRLQLEVRSERMQNLMVGVLGDDGTWMAITDALRTDSGWRPVGDHALQVDARPTSGWFVAGPPDAVAAVRRSGRPDARVVACRMDVEEGP